MAAADPDRIQRDRSRAAFALALVVHVLGGLWVALNAEFPSSFDELQHLSFIRWMGEHPQLLPAYEDMRILEAEAGGWSEVGNYLNHPSPYYLQMALVDRLLGGPILVLRLTNLLLSAIGVALMLLGGFRLLKAWTERALYAAVLVLFPKLAVMAGLINNDNDAVLSVGIAVVAFAAWLQAPGLRSGARTGLALAIAGWSKLTIFLMLGFALAIAEAPKLFKKERWPLKAYALIAAGGLLGAVPSLANLAAYGRPLFHSDFFDVPAEARAELSAVQYVLFFLGRLGEKWPATEPADLLQQLGLLLVLAAGAAATWLAFRRGGFGRDPAQTLAAAMVLALVPTLAIHLWFGWRTFLEDGFLEMAQTRYYYGVWPGFALAAALVWRQAPAGIARTGAAVVLLVLLLAASIFPLVLLSLVSGGVTVS